MPDSEQSHVTRLRKQGNKLAQLNKLCSKKVGTNKQGEHYRCLKKEAKKVFKK